MTKKYSYLLVFAILCFITYWFFKPVDISPESNISIPLRNKDSVNYLEISKAYISEQSDHSVTVHLDYASLLPNLLNNDMTRDVRIVLVVSTESIAAKLIHRLIADGCSINKSSTCEKFNVTLTGKQIVITEILHPKAVDKPYETEMWYYLNSRDAEPLLIHDAGSWSNTYEIYRDIDKNLQATIQYPKKIGTAFETIDKRLVNFIKSHLRYREFRTDIISSP